jgi:cobalt/nickel transport system permease protein
MAHIHLPEGAFTIFWAASWWIIAIVLIAVCVFWLRKVKKIDNRTITIAGLCTAAAFAIFQVEIPIPIPFIGGIHLNLTPLIGILAGPAVGGVIVLIVNIFSAAIGHGGWGLVGANCLINMAEVLVGYFTYRALGRLNLDTFSKAGTATILGLFVGNFAMIAIIMISGIQGVSISSINLLNSLVIIAGVNMFAAVIEAFVTGYVVAYLKKVRPDMLHEAPLSQEPKPRNGNLIFGALVVVTLILSLAVFILPNYLGLENAVSSITEQEEHVGGILGFHIEGNILLYAIIVLALIAVCYILYKKFKP